MVTPGGGIGVGRDGGWERRGGGFADSTSVCVDRPLGDFGWPVNYTQP